MCIVMGLAKLKIQAIHLQSSKFGEGLPVYPLPIYVSDTEDGDALVQTIGDAPGMTINGHGIVTVGKTIDEATMTAIYMERTAKIDHKEMLAYNRSKMAERGKSIARPTTDHSDEWRYYTRKIERGETWTRGWM
jgi:ribulose-5-phosphate 4-epimerase/fuculose-1-phosphate aldolase